jgi:hypothetical protein
MILCCKSSEQHPECKESIEGTQTKAVGENYDNDTPLDYGYVNDRDILWQRTTWEKKST